MKKTTKEFEKGQIIYVLTFHGTDNYRKHP